MATNERGRVRVEPGLKRVRVYLEGHLVADTLHPLLVWEIPYYPAYYLPLTDVRAELLPTGEVNHSPSRGDAPVHDVSIGGATAPKSARVYRDSPIEAIRDHVRFEWDSLSAWFEEDEEVFTHPRSPYSRIDILPTSRHVQVRLGDVVLADTTGGQVLFETGLPPRWYVPKVDARMDLLQRSTTLTRCPYKGQAEHWSAHIEGAETADVAWCYPAPLRESLNIAGLLAFYPDRVEVLVDGEPAPRAAHPPTPR